MIEVESGSARAQVDVKGGKPVAVYLKADHAKVDAEQACVVMQGDRPVAVHLYSEEAYKHADELDAAAGVVTDDEGRQVAGPPGGAHAVEFVRVVPVHGNAAPDGAW